MIKKSLLLAIAFLLFASVTASAQSEKSLTHPGLMKVYDDWKQKQLVDKAELPEHLAMAVVSQRIDGGSAQLDFALISKLSDDKLGNELILEIQPMITSLDADGKPTDSQAVGIATRTSITADETGNLSSPTTVSVLVPADARANSVIVKWVLSKRLTVEKQALSHNELHLLLGETPNSTLMAIVKAKTSEQ